MPSDKIELIGVYPISGDPPTWGHGDIMMRAAKKFTKVYWLIAQNSQKKTLFDTDQKIRMMSIYTSHYKLNNVEIVAHEGATVRFAKEVKADFIIRGLRSSSDYQHEYELSIGNRGIDKKIETICFFSKPHYATISSSIVRELARLGENISQYVHPEVAKIIQEHLK